MKPIESDMNNVISNLVEFTASVNPPPVYTDEWIERCAEVYHNLSIVNYGISFEKFVAYPRQALRQIRDVNAMLRSAGKLINEANDRINRKYDKNASPAIRNCGCRLVQPMHHRQPLSKRKTGNLH